MGALRGLGLPTSVSSISKNTRDEVLWKQAAAPWRRSPMWLLIRVSMHLVISRSPGGSHVLYKEIMVVIMSHILKSAIARGLPADMIYCMAAKIDRRLRKLSATGPPVLPHPARAQVDEVLRQSMVFLAKTWESCQKIYSDDLQLPTLSMLNFERDTLVRLPALDKHIAATYQRRGNDISAPFAPSSLLINNKPGCLPSVTDNRFKGSYAAANLGQFELWVAEQIDDWVAVNNGENSCKELHEVMIQYHDRAKFAYAHNPEATSLMVLTIFELWVACDKAAVRRCPLLGKYDPGIPPDILQSLLLPFLGQMKRLQALEEYIQDRKQKGIRKTDLLFASGNGQSFASQYFDTSATHQALLSEIETNATNKRQAKIQQLESVKAKYHELDSLYNAADCEYTTVVIDRECDPPKTKQKHCKKCEKCAYLRQRDELKIQVHEWPLPSNPSQAKTVVFELRIPTWLRHWRDARLLLLQDVLRGERTKVAPSTKYLLSTNDPHLTAKHSNPRTKPKIDLLSQKKPVSNTHYKEKSIPTLAESQLCVPNGLEYKYYCSQSDEYPGNLTFPDVLSRACTYAMPCPALERFVLRPASSSDGPEPNTVIASQNNCPKNMSLEEYKEFGALPLGHRIQWPNILLQLAMPSLDFKKPETTLLLLQCAYQTGPKSEGTSNSTALRSAHNFFSHKENAASLLKHLTGALQRVKCNWESSQALFVFAALAARALSLSRSPSVQKDFLMFLSTVRDIAMEWVISLRDKAYEAVDHKDRTTVTAKSVEVALICISTFDVDSHHLEAVLMEARYASILVKSCIVVQEGKNALASRKEPVLAVLDMRHKRLLCRTYRLLAKNSAALDDGIKETWSAYTRGSAWRTASETWVTTDTLATTQTASMSVHYNLLSGELLANGLPLDQPPEKYRAHPQYSVLFGKAVIQVMPSTTPGFQFSTKREFGGFSVQLGMSGGDLVVRATKGNMIYETLPSRLFAEAYPTSFVEDYIHWFNVATNSVQFRPIHEPWNSSASEVWTLLLEPSLPIKWQLSKSKFSVVGIDSSTSQSLSRVFEPLAVHTRIHNILRPSGGPKTLLISIPRLNLTFSLPEGSELLESNEFRSMVVDADQSLGTLVGLRSKLVLKHSTRNERMVLVPESEAVTYRRAKNHVSVAVDQESIHRVHPLRVDPTLGRLLDNGELGCKLFLAYLHALTSFCLVDPLTKKTGTEQSLTILQSAAVRSFDQLSQANIDMLAKIAALSPGRCYYPPHKKVMQTVQWDKSISFLSQHGHFTTAINTVLKQAEQALTFFPDVVLSFPRLDRSDQHLLQRDNVRSATFRVSGFGAEDHKSHNDRTYKARDRDSASQLATRAFIVSRLIFRDGLKRYHPDLTENGLWNAMRTLHAVSGADSPMELSSLKYDASLLRDGYKDILQCLLPLHRCLAVSADSQRYKFSVTMWLSTIAANPEANLPILQFIAMLIKDPNSARASRANAPQMGSFEPKAGDTVAKGQISRILRQHLLPLQSCPEQNLVRASKEKNKAYLSRRQKQWLDASNAAVATLVSSFASQWPCDGAFNLVPSSIYVRVNGAMPGVRSLFKTWFDNRQLHHYLNHVQTVMPPFLYEAIGVVESTMRAPQMRPRVAGCVTERSMFLLAAPDLPEPLPAADFPLVCAAQQQSLGERPRLTSVVDHLERLAGRSKYETQYVADLRASLDALVSRADDGLPSANVTAVELSCHLKSCTEYVRELYTALKAAVIPSDSSRTIQFTHQLPRISPAFFLRQLSGKRWSNLSAEWKACIVGYALALAAMQRAERLTKLTEKQDLINELRNLGHQNWDPAEYPETLLMEVESGFLVRDVQAQVAEQMQTPPGGKNAVMQLNMGEGKSSVIVPMVATALANGKQLLRVVVAKPQSKQMAQMLISKLGGLLNRRLYYMPISRSLKFDSTAARSISDMLKDCMSSGGVLLVQPEHILSFQLMAIECPVLGREDVARQLVTTQRFLEDNARDVVDESDENFNVRFELIYTMGSQHPIELSPDRWLLLQELLGVVRRFASAIAKTLPLSLEFHPGMQGSFPRLRILRPDGGRLLKKLLADHVCNNGLGSLQVSRQPQKIRKAVHAYISHPELSKEEISAVEGSLFWTETTKEPLLLIRGVIACGILEFVLAQKRWRVNYGLASRTPPTQLAVPYRAKDSPSLRAEFSHPDVVITLTSLSYYYGGLSEDDLFIAMGRLMETDQSDVEYQAWVRDANRLPDAFKQLQGINLKDRPLCISKVFPALRFAKSVIDFFLAHIVFPKEMKEFPHKLSASGWDIGKRKRRPVTGFSGTNDSRCVLPISVNHLDHPAQKHTNALVLEHLLRPDNGVELMGPVAEHTSDAEHLLATVLHLIPPVQVILDVGAQILELTNIDVAKTWLKKHDSTKEAAVFINDEDELCVVDREDRVDLLRASPFSARLDACLVFLDEAHTRGIDLRLPSDYRAAVTLGASLTKDRLVQACMRMRKLGKGQTVVFCISQEIQAKITENKEIREDPATGTSSAIRLEDVVLWSVSETHVDLRRSMPLWVVQGKRFVRQDRLWRWARQQGRSVLPQDYAKKFLEKEAQTLDDRFRPRQGQGLPIDATSAANPDLRQIAERCQQFGQLQFNASTLQEEQERELSPEIEQERQVQRVPNATPAAHWLHDDVLKFVFEGLIIQDSTAYMPAFQSLEDSSAASGFSVRQLAGESRLLVTADFAKTVKASDRPSHLSDVFQRPVQWLLTSRAEGTANVDRIMIISPYEANKLYKLMETSTETALHVFKPRCNSGYASLDELDFHTVTAQVGTSVVPRKLAMQLALFSGQLYISSFADYKEICSILGLSAQKVTQEMSEKGWKVAADGFILSDDQGRVGGGSGLRDSHVKFFKILMSKIRRNGDGISKTHMGGLLEGKLFQQSDFEQ